MEESGFTQRPHHTCYVLFSSHRSLPPAHRSHIGGIAVGLKLQNLNHTPKFSLFQGDAESL